MGYGSSWKLFGKMQLLSWNPSLFTTVQLQLIKSHLATLPFQRCLMVLENNDTLMNQTLTKKFSNRPQSQSNFDWAGRLKLAYVRLKMDNKQENRACFAECFLFLSRLRAVSLFSVVHRAKRETRKWPRAWLMALRRSRARALLSLNLKKKRDCSQSIVGYLTAEYRVSWKNIISSYSYAFTNNQQPRHFNPSTEWRFFHICFALFEYTTRAHTPILLHYDEVPAELTLAFSALAIGVRACFSSRDDNKSVRVNTN